MTPVIPKPLGIIYDVVDYVGDKTNLTYSNVAYLIFEAISSRNSDNLAVVAIAQRVGDREMDFDLRDQILKFIIGVEDKISIALCKGSIEVLDGRRQISGDTHWTGLHLRKISEDNNKLSIKAYCLDSTSDEVPDAINRVLGTITDTSLASPALWGDEESLALTQVLFDGIKNINNIQAVAVKCKKQTDSHSCGFHAVYNLKAMHEKPNIEDSVNLGESLGEASVDNFINVKREKLKIEFNPSIDTSVKERTKQRSTKRKEVVKEEVAGRSLFDYEEDAINVFFGNDDNLEKLKKITACEQLINQIVLDDDNKAENSKVFQKYYQKILEDFVLDLSFQCQEMRLSEERENFFTKLRSKETAKDPRKFLEILEKIDKNPSEIENAIKEIEEEKEKRGGETKKAQPPIDDKADKDPISEEDKFFFNNKIHLVSDDGMTLLSKDISSLFSKYDQNLTFRDRIDALPRKIKTSLSPRQIGFNKRFEDILVSKFESDRARFLTTMMPDRLQPKPESEFAGWGLDAVFKGMDLKIEGKEVSKILDKNGKDILNELKEDKYYKNNPELFAQAVIYFFRKELGDIKLVYSDKNNAIKNLPRSDKVVLKISDDGTLIKEKNQETLEVLEGEYFNLDSGDLLRKRLFSYFVPTTKAPEETPEVDAPPRDRQYNLNLGKDNIKRYGFLGEDSSGYDKSGKANANNFIIVDPAGSAFENNSTCNGDLSGSGASGALYKKFNTRPTGAVREGVGVNDKNEINIIYAGYAVYNNLSAPNKDFYGIIHAVGPCNQGDNQEGLLTQCLKNIFIEYDREASKETKDRPGLRIPAISGSIYRNVMHDESGKAILQSDDDYNAMLIRAIENGHKMACKELQEKEITFGNHGLEICMYEQKMYNSIIKNITALPSTIPSTRDSKPMTLAKPVEEIGHA